MTALAVAAALLASGCAHLGPAAPTESTAGIAERVDAQITRHLDAGDLDAALELLDAAVTAHERLLAEDPPALAAYLGDLGVRFYNAPIRTAEAWEAAASLIERELSLRRSVFGKNHLEVAESLDSLAQIHHGLGQWRRAAGEAEQALLIRESLLEPDDPLLADALFGLAAVYFDVGRYRDAGPHVDRAIALLRGAEATGRLLLADCLNLRGELFRVGNRFAAAEGTLREGLAVARAVVEDDLDPVVQDLLNNLVGVYKDEGRYDEAELTYRQILASLEADTALFAPEVATVLLNQAELHRLVGRPEEAEPLYREALATAREALGEGHPDLVSFFGQLAVLLAAEDRPDEAGRLFREALGLLKRAGERHTNPWAAQALNDYGRLERSRRRYRKAEKLYREALAIRERVFGADHPDVAWTLTELARDLFMAGGRDAEALELARRALGTFAATPAYPEMRIEALALEAEILARRGDRKAAIGRLAEALAEVEELRPRIGGDEASRAEFLSRYVHFFNLMIAWQIAGGEPAEALRYAERMRARVLLDQLAAARVDLRRGIPDELLAPLEQRVAEAETRLAEARRRLDTLASDRHAGAQEMADLELELRSAARELRRSTGEIRSASPLWHDVVTAGGRTVEPEVVQRGLIPADGLLLLYQIGRDASFLFVVPPAPGEIEAVPLEIPPAAAETLAVPVGRLGSPALEGMISSRAPSSVDEALRDRQGGPKPARRSDSGDPAERLHALWQVLVPPPLRPRLRRASEVVVVPDGVLHALPFEALVVAPPSAGAGIRYWLDDGPPIRYAASATSLYNLAQRVQERRSPGLSALVVADPVFDLDAVAPPPARDAARQRFSRAGLRRLPGTAREAEALDEILNDGSTEETVFLRGVEADEQAVRAALARTPRLVHFATHGLVDRQSELLAALALTPPHDEPLRSDNDGLLQLFEIYELDLDAELTVLAACESHAGRRVAGEGVFALSRGFLAAGAQRVVASLWPVDDASTAALMAGLYRRLAAARAAGEKPVYSRALAEARRAVREQEKWSAPYFWAPFVLSGLR